MPSRDEKMAHLQQVPLFSTLSKRELAMVARHADEVEVGEGTVLCQEGAMAREFGLILSGSADVRKAGKKIASLGPGDFYGEMAILDPAPRSASVITTSHSTLLVMFRQDFLAVLDAVPKVDQKLLAVMARRLREADKRLIQ